MREPTFWHTSLGRALAPLLQRPLICGQTCGCSRVTGCLGASMEPSSASWEDRREVRTGEKFWKDRNHDAKTDGRPPVPNP